MPFNEDFTLRIMVGGTVLPEYQKNGMCYVESNLFTPYSYSQVSSQVVNDEVERQSWPVTPFTISIEAKPSAPCCYYRIYVDGQKVKSVSVPPSQTRVVRGFRDRYCVKEFLFSLPRFALNEADRLDTENSCRVGLIEVECYNATHRSSKQSIRLKKLEFEQANKKDCSRVTGGQYLMATTKSGRIIEQKTAMKMTDYWDVHSLRNKLIVKYVTAQTLKDMNLKVVPIPFPQTDSPTNSPSQSQQGSIIYSRTTPLAVSQTTPIANSGTVQSANLSNGKAGIKGLVADEKKGSETMETKKIKIDTEDEEAARVLTSLSESLQSRRALDFDVDEDGVIILD